MSFDLVATRNIGTDEEIFIDYGTAWLHAWEEHVTKWGWVVDKDGRINFPDQQLRIYKNDPERIYWTKPVHEQLVGYTKYAALPGNEEYCLHHPKDIKRQEKQNNFYDTI